MQSLPRSVQQTMAVASTGTALYLSHRLMQGLSEGNVSFLAVVVLPLSCLFAAYFAWPTVEPIARFAYACFLQPLGKSDQSTRLDRFYKAQASIYDATRGKLLRGRHTMLQLVAAQIQEQRRRQPPFGRIWVDIGGGTGWNIEEMQRYIDLNSFDAIYLIDLCEPLLDVARKRFKDRKNIHVLRQDATAFTLPEWEKGSERLIDVITLSYAYSMMPNYYALTERMDRFLRNDGIVGVCDFYVSGREASPLSQAVGAVGRQCNWLSRFFWLHWFEWDHVDLHPSRRAYLEFRFGTLKSYNGRNQFFFTKIPYYIWLGCKADRDVACAVKAFDVDAGNTISASSSPVLRPRIKGVDAMPDLSIGTPALPKVSSFRPPSPAGSASFRIDVDSFSPLSSFYYQLSQHRVPYVDTDVHKEFRTWIYGFTWEDPSVDVKAFNLTEDDRMLVITSAGDNALHYAIDAKPQTIHAVDMNPCQGHLLELKLACIQALEYEDFWKLFGEGKHPDFRGLLDGKISPYLSSHAYQFWRQNVDSFEHAFYLRGYSGWALRVCRWVLKLHRAEELVVKFCNASCLGEQREIWRDGLRDILLNSPLLRFCVGNPVFLWQALGVPMNQAALFKAETTPLQYLVDTLDPIAKHSHLRDDNYHYYLCLMARYSPSCCPLYLTRDGFSALKRDAGRLTESFRLHTASIIEVLQQLEPGSLTVWVGMDHMDWFTDSSTSKTTGQPTDGAIVCELKKAVRALHRALATGGRAFWRSAAMAPWYADVFAQEGFKVERLSVRSIACDKPIDNVNMYASFYKAIKL